MKIVFVEDIVDSRFYEFLLTNKDMARASSVWNKPDKIIVDLSHTKLFDKKRLWSDLTSDHFKFLICGSFPSLKTLSSDDITNSSIPAVDSFHFITSLLIYYLEIKSEFKIRSLAIRRIRSDYLDFDITGSSSLELKNITSKPGLKIIVDNTKSDNKES